MLKGPAMWGRGFDQSVLVACSGSSDRCYATSSPSYAPNSWAPTCQVAHDVLTAHQLWSYVEFGGCFDSVAPRASRLRATAVDAWSTCQKTFRMRELTM